jgi:hypothetical protein
MKRYLPTGIPYGVTLGDTSSLSSRPLRKTNGMMRPKAIILATTMPAFMEHWCKLEMKLNPGKMKH